MLRRPIESTRRKLTFRRAQKASPLCQEETLAGWSLYFRFVPKAAIDVCGDTDLVRFKDSTDVLLKCLVVSMPRGIPPSVVPKTTR